MAARERLICGSDVLAGSGAGVRFEVQRGDETVPAFIVRYDGQVHAYINRCTHMRMELDWKLGRFFDDEGLHLVCSMHGAVYAPDTGECRGGPCAGALAQLEVEERDGCVYLKG